MLDLVTIDEAKTHLRISINEDDDDLQIKINAASKMVLSHIGEDDSTYADYASVPADVKAATLVLVGRLDMDREGDVDGDGHLPPVVRALLSDYHDPVSA